MNPSTGAATSTFNDSTTNDAFPEGSPDSLVCQALKAATDLNPDLVHRAQEQLLAWEQQPGFLPTLARLCATTTVPPTTAADDNKINNNDVHVRWMAAVYLKNAINKYWKRSGRQYVLPDEEKQQIRTVLLDHFKDEQVSQVAVQVAVLIARIARNDYPKEWPDLLPEITKRLQIYVATTSVESLRNVNRVEEQRVLLVQHHVIKALASRRLMADKRMFEDLTMNIFPFVLQLWEGYTNICFQQLRSSPDVSYLALERAHMALRTLRKLCVYGYARRNKLDEMWRFFDQIFVWLAQTVKIRFELLPHMDREAPMIVLLEKFILKMMKTLNDFQDMHGAAFTRYVPIALEFSFQHVFHEQAHLMFGANNEINFPNFAILCINLMKGIMLCSHYTASNAAANLSSATAASPTASGGAASTEDPVSFQMSDFFTENRLTYICDKLVTHYFLLTRGELEKWDSDPEGFAQDDGGERYRYDLRPCVETFYFTCFSHYTNAMTAEVVKFVNRSQEIALKTNSELSHILLKDAIYNAVGLAAFHFFNEIDFNAWFRTQLLDELRIDSNNFRILRRRIIWLIAEFTPVKFDKELRPMAYEACLHLLRPEEDFCVRLAASRTLCALVSDFEFVALNFLPYMEQAFNALFVLLSNAKECETKMVVLSSMSTLVENMNQYAAPIADRLIAMLPLLWRESEDHHMLRCNIIFTLQQLIKAMSDVPEGMKSFLYSVIQYSTDVGQPAHVYLMEEGLSLWSAVVENSRQFTPELMHLCRQILPILEMTTENMRIIFFLIQAYVLLDARAFLESYGQAIVGFCVRTFDDIRDDGIVLMLKVFEVCLKADGDYSLQLLRPLLPMIFKYVYEDKTFPMVLSMFFMMLARTLLINQAVFTEIVQGLQYPDALEKILDIWIVKMPLVKDLDKRKLYSLAFASILNNNALVLERFAGIMQNICETLEDLMGEEEETDAHDDGVGDCSNDTTPNGGCGGRPRSHVIKYSDTLVFSVPYEIETSLFCHPDNQPERDSYHYDRCRELSLKDPVHTYVLADYVQYQLNALCTQMGRQAYVQLWQNVDTTVKQRLSQYLKLISDI